MATRRPQPLTQIDTELYQRIVEIYSRWPAQDIVDAIGYYRRQVQEQQQRAHIEREIERLNNELEQIPKQ